MIYIHNVLDETLSEVTGTQTSTTSAAQEMEHGTTQSTTMQQLQNNVATRKSAATFQVRTEVSKPFSPSHLPIQNYHCR